MYAWRVLDRNVQQRHNLSRMFEVSPKAAQVMLYRERVLTYHKASSQQSDAHHHSPTRKALLFSQLRLERKQKHGNKILKPQQQGCYEMLSCLQLLLLNVGRYAD